MAARHSHSFFRPPCCSPSNVCNSRVLAGHVHTYKPLRGLVKYRMPSLMHVINEMWRENCGNGEKNAFAMQANWN